MAKSMAMKVKAKVKAKAKAMKVKGKVQHVQKAEDEAKATHTSLHHAHSQFNIDKHKATNNYDKCINYILILR